MLPVLGQFAPDIVLVSAGFDAHERDPLGGMRLSTQAFPAMTGRLAALADAHAEGRLVLVTEGGYDLRALTGSLSSVIAVLEGRWGEAAWPCDAADAGARGRAAVAAARDNLSRYWRLPD
jgi:acetoin utilization deacetylase AcuC-like enzyme